jgi:hypothetical protein
VDRADGLGVAACADVVVAGHGHGAESYARDVESAERDVLHGVFLTGPFAMRQCHCMALKTFAGFAEVIA